MRKTKAKELIGKLEGEVPIVRIEDCLKKKVMIYSFKR